MNTLGNRYYISRDNLRSYNRILSGFIFYRIFEGNIFVIVQVCPNKDITNLLKLLTI
jgi:hypothetical protein